MRSATQFSVAATALLVLSCTAFVTQAQDESGPPEIVLATLVEPDALSCLPALITCGSPDVLWEGELAGVCVTVYDPDFITEPTDPNDPEAEREESDERICLNLFAIWWPYVANNVVYGPEPPPVATSTGKCIYGPFAGDPNTGLVTVLLPFVVPPFNGRNAARMRGDIDFDVRWEVRVQAIDSGEEATPPVPLSDGFMILPVCAVENPFLAEGNPPPFANAGGSRTVGIGDVVVLDGSRTFDAINVGFDPLSPQIFDKDELQYAWEWVSGPERVDPVPDTQNPAKARVTLNVEGEYVYKVTVTDGVNTLPSTDALTLTAVDPAKLPRNSSPPNAVVQGPTTPVLIGNEITLSGALSSDPDGDPISYRWMQTNELGGALTPEEVFESFQPLSGVTEMTSTWQATTPGTFHFRLLVSDPFGNTDAAMFSVEVVDAATAGARVIFGRSYLPAPDSEADADTPAELADEAPQSPFGCGRGLLPVAAVPLVLLLMRGRLR